MSRLFAWVEGFGFEVERNRCAQVQVGCVKSAQTHLVGRKVDLDDENATGTQNGASAQSLDTPYLMPSALDAPHIHKRPCVRFLLPGVTS